MKPGLKPLIAGILLMITALLIPVLIIVQTVQQVASNPEERFEIPGQVEFVAEESGRYYLWHHFDTVYEGETFHEDPELPSGLKIEVTDEHGEAIDFVGSGSMTVNGTSGSKRSVGYIELSGPDVLTFTVSGECPPTVFSVSQFKLFEILSSFFMGFAMAALCALIGLALLIWGIIRLCTAKKTPPPVPTEAVE